MTQDSAPKNWQPLQLNDLGSPAGKIRDSKKTAVKHEMASPSAFDKGYQDGLAAGRAEGFAAGEAAGLAEGQQAARQLLSLAANLDSALTDLDQEIAEELLALGLEVARQMLRQLVSVNPTTILAVLREGLNQLPHQHAAIYLNPEDAELVRRLAGEQFAHAGHRINEDSLLQRGDVIIEANGAQVDATLATRWRRVIESLGSKTSWVEEERQP